MVLRLRIELQILVRTCIGAAMLLCALFAFPVQGFADGFSGQFDGIGTAVGMTLTLEEADGRVVGRFASGRGDPFSLNGRRTGEAAQGSVSRTGQNFFFHLETRPLGVQFLLIPKTPEGGPDISGATDYSFVQQGLQVPQPSAYRAAPPRGIDVDIIDFIDAFRDWAPEDMARIYASLDDRYKDLIQLFDHAAAEVVWRVCATNPPKDFFPEAELVRLLERQRSQCTPYLASVAAVRDAGLLNEFFRKANFQFELIRETVKCDRGQSPETKCADVSAMSGPLMVRWRRASDILSELIGDRVASAEAEEIEIGEAAPSRSEESAGDQVRVSQVTGASSGGYSLPRQRPGAWSGRDGEELSAADEQGDTGAMAPVEQVPVPRIRPGVRLRP